MIGDAGRRFHVVMELINDQCEMSIMNCTLILQKVCKALSKVFLSEPYIIRIFGVLNLLFTDIYELK